MLSLINGKRTVSLDITCACVCMCTPQGGYVPNKREESTFLTSEKPNKNQTAEL